MAIIPANVWDWIGPDGNRQGQAVADALMARVVNAVEQLWMERWSVLVADPVTITAVDDLVTFTGHGYANGAIVALSKLVAAEPLRSGRAYFVRDSTANSFKLAAVAAGAAIDVTSDGTASAPLAARPQYIDQALIMQAAALYGRKKTTDGVIAGTQEVGPIRIARFDPDVERILDDGSWGVR